MFAYTVVYLYAYVYACVFTRTHAQLCEYVMGLITPSHMKFTHHLCCKEQLRKVSVNGS